MSSDRNPVGAEQRSEIVPCKPGVQLGAHTASPRLPGGQLTHEHRVADIVVCTYVLSGVRDGVHYMRRQAQMRHVRHDS